MKQVNIDYEQINTLKFLEFNTEEEIIESLMQIFDYQYKEITQHLQIAILKKEYYEASRLSHKLKSSALQLGMKDVAATCLYLEIELKNLNTHNYEDIIKTLSENSKNSLQAINLYLEQQSKKQCVA